MGYYYKRNNYNHCAYCGEECYYELCKTCYELSKEDLIIKNEDEEWIKNVIKGNEYKFYDETKTYTIKDNVLNNTEKNFYEYVKKNLKKKYTITPQVNLQTIIDTDTNTRNDELYRNIDFCIFRTKGYVPILAIELNGRQHYSDTFWIERDKSIQKILESANLKLITIKNEELKIDKQLLKKIYNEIKHINSKSNQNDEYTINTRIHHKKYGNGTIINIQDEIVNNFGHKEKIKIVTILFDNNRRTGLALDYSIQKKIINIIK